MNRTYYFWSNKVSVKSNEPGKNSYFPKFLVKHYTLNTQILEFISYKVTPLMFPYSHFTMHLSILLVIFFNSTCPVKASVQHKKKKNEEDSQACTTVLFLNVHGHLISKKLMAGEGHRDHTHSHLGRHLEINMMRQYKTYIDCQLVYLDNHFLFGDLHNT